MPTLVPTKVEVKTIDPPPPSSMAGICRLAPRKAPVGVAGREVDGESLSPFLRHHLGKRLVRSDRAGVVERDVEAAEHVARRLDHSSVRLVLAHVAGNGIGTPAGSRDLLDHHLEVLLAAGVEDERRAFGREQPCGGKPNSAGRTGDDGNLVLKHLDLLPC